MSASNMRRLILLFFICSCSYLGPEELIRNEDDIQLYDYYIDDNGNEGVVVYKTEQDILVISIDEGLVSWGPGDLSIMPHGLHSGGKCSMKTMQNAIFYGIDRFPAFKWCNAKNPDGQLNVTSWMLPCANEMRYLFYQVDISYLNKVLMKIGGTPISPGELYWTASEDTYYFDQYDDYGNNYIPEMRAVCMTPELDSDYKIIYWIKSQKHRVRAVKYIKYK